MRKKVGLHDSECSNKWFTQTLQPGAVARSDACSLGMQAAPSSIPSPAHSFVETWP